MWCEEARAHIASRLDHESPGWSRRIATRAALAALALGAAPVGSLWSGGRSHGPSVRVPSAQAGGAVLASVPNGRVFDGTPAVGALFTRSSNGGLGARLCTASVVASSQHDLLMTAAHCVTGQTAGDLDYVPEYHQGRTPFGVWRVAAVFVDRAWERSRDPNDDFAFLVAVRSASVGRVQSVTGGERIGFSKPPVETVQVIGYPSDEDSPITCANRTSSFSATQLRFDCGGYTDGTSGGPFLSDVNPTNSLGTVIGVIGGYQQGGDTPSVSYAARLLTSASALYAQAGASAAAKAG